MSTFDALVSGRWAMLPSYLSIFAGVIDRSVSDDDLQHARAIKAARAERHAVLASQGRILDNTEGVVLRDGVAIVPITGPIFRYADIFTDISGGATVERLAQDIQAATTAANVSSIVLWIDSPGGELTGINALAQQIAAATKIKPVTAYIEGLGASAAYWLAVAAGKGNIVADATAIVGSIGVVMAIRDPTKTKALDLEFVSEDAPNKRPDVTTDRGRAEVQRTVNDLSAVFRETVATYRGITPERVISEFGAGGVKVGQQALDAGMIDRLGTLESVIAEASRPASPSVQRFALSAKGVTGMDWSGFWGGMFKAAKDADVDITPPPTPTPAAVNQPLADRPTGSDPRDQEIAALRKQVAEGQEQRIQAEAASAFAQLRTANKVLPAEESKFLAAYIQAARDDATHGGGVQRTTIVTDLYTARTPHTLTQELVPVDVTATAIGNRTETDPTAEEERKAREAGRAAAERANGKKGGR